MTTTLDQQMRDCMIGEQAIKANDLAAQRNEDRYLHMTASQRKNDTDGQQEYNTYVHRATTITNFTDTINSALGMMAESPSKVDVPDALIPMTKSITGDGQSVQALEAKVNSEQCIVGQYGLLLDVKDGKNIPHIVTYITESILGKQTDANDDIRWITLDETTKVFDYKEKVWTDKKQFRLCAIRTDAGETPVYYTVLIEYEDGEKWDTAKKWKDWNIEAPTNENKMNDSYFEPNIQGKTLDFVPFTFANITDIQSKKQLPPFLSLVNITFAYYRGAADYRLALFMQGIAILYQLGIDNFSDIVGPGVSINSTRPANESKIGFAVSIGAGLSETRESLENLKLEAQSTGVTILNSAQKESGEALKLRINVQTASLKRIAKTGAMAIEQQFKFAAIWMGLNPDDVSVEANLEYADVDAAISQFVALVSADDNGLSPLSGETLWNIAKAKNITQFDSYEEEQKAKENDQQRAINANAITPIAE